MAYTIFPPLLVLILFLLFLICILLLIDSYKVLKSLYIMLNPLKESRHFFKKKCNVNALTPNLCVSSAVSKHIFVC